MTYNYFPDEINTNDVMKMRFELADTDVSKDEMSAALSDEEITAVLEQYPDNFKMAKLKLLEHMMFKYGQDVDNSVGPVSFNFGNRMNFWKQKLHLPVLESSRMRMKNESIFTLV